MASWGERNFTCRGDSKKTVDPSNVFDGKIPKKKKGPEKERHRNQESPSCLCCQKFVFTQAPRKPNHSNLEHAQKGQGEGREGGGRNLRKPRTSNSIILDFNKQIGTKSIGTLDARDGGRKSGKKNLLGKEVLEGGFKNPERKTNKHKKKTDKIGAGGKRFRRSGGRTGLGGKKKIVASQGRIQRSNAHHTWMCAAISPAIKKGCLGPIARTSKMLGGPKGAPAGKFFHATKTAKKKKDHIAQSGKRTSQVERGCWGRGGQESWLAWECQKKKPNSHCKEGTIPRKKD